MTVSGPELAAERALHTFEAIRGRRLYSRRHRVFGRRWWVFWRQWEALWPFANAWSAVGTLDSLVPEGEVDDALACFLDGVWAYRMPSEAVSVEGPALGLECRVTSPIGRGGDRFYDDNAWIGLALMHHHRQTVQPDTLVLARRLLAFDLSGWALDPTWSCPGGIRWEEPASCTSRNTCSNGPVAELALLVHLATGDDGALEWGLRIYEWVRSCLLGTEGLYFDRIAADGTVTRDLYSYNQGTMIGAGVLLHRITGDRRYLDQARTTAAAGMAHFGLPVLLRQDPAFNAVWVRNLLMLAEVDPATEPRPMATAYGDAMWETVRNPRTGFFGAPPVLNATAPMVELYTLLAGAPPHP